MSNNKQSMKLYTEEQIFKYLLENGTIDLDSFILDMKPIELPSDEEIEQIADACHPFAEQIGGDIYVAYRAFKQGLQFMHDKIQGGKK